jgi:O-antigen/teichoic acid export membrane protein
MSATARTMWLPGRAAASRLRERFAGRRTFAFFVLSVGVLNVTSLLGNALAFRWVDPASMGVWHTLLLASSYLTVIRLGLISGMGRELPFALGSGDLERARRIAATSLTYSMACSAFAALTFAGLSLFFWSSSPAWRFALPAVAVVSASNLYLSYLHATFRSESDFARLARVHWVHAVSALLMPVMVYGFGFPGLCAHAALQAILITAYAHGLRPLRVPLRFEPGLAKHLLATGLPLFVAGYLQTAAAGFDRIILLQRGTVETVGYYAPALAVIAAMAIIPGAIATYVYPRMSFALGQGRKSGSLRRMALTAGATSFLAGLPVAAAGWLAAPYAIGQFFPQYVPSIPAVRWSLLSGLLWSISPAIQALGSLKAWRSLSFYIVVLLAARWTFPWLLSRSGEPLAGVALGNVYAAACTGMVALWLVRRTTVAGPVPVPVSEESLG